ncbi:MAG TPA: hypothetical protein VGJ59_11280 [Jatrophihabitantaceae bacterium]|jgi:hypothetical protein
MDYEPTPAEARAALEVVERGRLRVIEQIDVPGWYWWGLALGWIGLGVITDLAHPWITAAATLAFGAIHSAIAPRVIDGRRRSPQLSVRSDVVGRRLPQLVLGGLLLLAGVTVAGSLALAADGAGHPVTIASVVVAFVIALGGPQLLAVVRRRAVQAGPRA